MNRLLGKDTGGSHLCARTGSFLRAHDHRHAFARLAVGFLTLPDSQDRLTLAAFFHPRHFFAGFPETTTVYAWPLPTGATGADRQHFDTRICGIITIVIVVESGMVRRCPAL